ncbi:MAG: ribonuclease R [Ignavibacteria bacterium]|nr:ribonuclease R [Ignavibacteria bacterium]MBT8380794.1 ribonuclease R [Ignavibacteria bacterium]MBT8392745.1 ribonuclease R [Ignavibacteria bacterium]NNJ54306.1 ribonuclease R [Ignavibacteriaceae bacterium]NNL22060.1 ribonuclease R [Ignavibacteriaceae bacterium]
MKNQIKSFFKTNPNRNFKSKEVAKRLKIKTEKDYKELKTTLHKLAVEKFLSKNGKKYKLKSLPDTNRIVGHFQLNEGGFGFVLPKNNKLKDIYISARNSNNAFHGDLVEVVFFAKQKGKNLEGQITKVIRRKRKQFVGQLRKSKSFYFISPDDVKIHRDIYIDREDLHGAKPGDKVTVGKINWDDRMLNPEGEVVEILGEEGTLDAEVISIAREFGIPTAFSKSVLREAEEINISITEEDVNKRIDFREKNVFTIDPRDAKDFDDALSIEKLDNGNFKVGVHIADVSHYVKAGSELDEEALNRGNSTYFVGKAIPMLPEKLSNNICSLVPNEDRLTFSAIFEITQNGRVNGYQIAKTIINSKRRFTYEEAQKIIETGSGEYSEEIVLLDKIATKLRKKRFREGSLEFFTAEVEFELDTDGKPVNIVKKEIKESNMLVEEFMLLANKSVAEKISRKKKIPFAYRIHDFPDQEKIEEFSRFVKSLGYSFNPHSGKAASQFNKLMESVKGTEEEGVINELAIRSMAKAVYSAQNIGHYGLGFSFYTHFTSPIRRYADLIVHRIVDKTPKNKSGINYSLEELDEICDHISAAERNSMEAERLSVKQKQVQFLKNKIGEEFNAVISGVASFGIFVELTDFLAQGLIRARDLEGDFYVLSEKKYSLIGNRTKKQFRLGDRICVKLVRVDLDNLEMDFIIKENG